MCCKNGDNTAQFVICVSVHLFMCIVSTCLLFVCLYMSAVCVSVHVCCLCVCTCLLFVCLYMSAVCVSVSHCPFLPPVTPAQRTHVYLMVAAASKLIAVITTFPYKVIRSRLMQVGHV